MGGLGSFGLHGTIVNYVMCAGVVTQVLYILVQWILTDPNLDYPTS